MTMRMGVARAACACVVGLLAATPTQARAEESEFSAPARAALDPSSTLTYRSAIERGDRRVVGGIVYALLPGTPAEAYAAMRERERFPEVFPRLRGFKLAGENPPDLFVEFQYGGSSFRSVHTMRLRYDDQHRTIRFWIDPRYPHDVRDAWGFFEFQPDPNDPKRTILTYAVLVDLGFGMFDVALEGRVQELLLSVPARLQRSMAAKPAARGR